MQALSLRQPWAWLMIRPDLKTMTERVRASETGILKQVENRPWNCLKRETVLVHASSSMPAWYHAEAAKFARTNFGIIVPDRDDPQLQLGGIIGRFEIYDCVASSKDPWFFGPYGILVRDATPLPFRPCSGRQRWFTPEYSAP
jgi:hypothetical protein